MPAVLIGDKAALTPLIIHKPTEIISVHTRVIIWWRTVVTRLPTFILNILILTIGATPVVLTDLVPFGGTVGEEGAAMCEGFTSPVSEFPGESFAVFAWFVRRGGRLTTWVTRAWWW